MKNVFLGLFVIVGLTACGPKNQAQVTQLVTDGLSCYTQVNAALPQCKAQIPACFTLAKSAQDAANTK